jgi:hypothetical protein
MGLAGSAGPGFGGDGVGGSALAVGVTLPGTAGELAGSGVVTEASPLLAGLVIVPTPESWPASPWDSKFVRSQARALSAKSPDREAWRRDGWLDLARASAEGPCL